MNKINILYCSLKDWFDESFDNQKNDPVKHIVALTYEFDDQQLVNLVCGNNLDDDFQIRTSQLKTIASLRPIIIYDSRKTNEFNSLPHFLELYPIHNKGFSCHHSKAYLIVSEKHIRLCMGSCNLTHSGMFKNREVWSNFKWNESLTDNLNILEDFINILRQHYCTSLGTEFENSITTVFNSIDEITNKLEFKKSGIKEYSLLSSGYDNKSQGLSQLKTLWDDNKINKLFVVSPFFDQGENAFLIKDIISEFGTINECEIITDEKNITYFSKEHFGKVKNKILKIIPTLISEEEKNRIQRANNNQSIKDLIINRPLHAKILVLIAEDGNGLLYHGSANFSRKAWNGENRELGLVSKITNANKLIDSICKELNVNEKNRFEQLEDNMNSSICEDDEIPKLDYNFPEFINKIILQSKTSPLNIKQVFFEFFSDELPKLKSYDVYWGKTKIIFNGNISQSININDFFAYSNLIGNRNLKFILKSNSVKFYYYPFIYSESIQIEKENIVYTNSNDWLEYYLGEQETPLPLNEWIPGQNDNQTPIDNELNVDRDKNVVIKMQHYLNKFSRVEKEFKSRVTEINNEKLSDIEKEKKIEKQVVKPLHVLGNILDREKESDFDISFLFKMGELILFIKGLNLNATKIQESSKSLLKLIPSNKFNDDTYKSYRNHIEG